MKNWMHKMEVRFVDWQWKRAKKRVERNRREKESRRWGHQPPRQKAWAAINLVLMLLYLFAGLAMFVAPTIIHW